MPLGERPKGDNALSFTRVSIALLSCALVYNTLAGTRLKPLGIAAVALTLAVLLRYAAARPRRAAAVATVWATLSVILQLASLQVAPAALVPLVLDLGAAASGLYAFRHLSRNQSSHRGFSK